MEKQNNDADKWNEIIKYYAELQKQADESKKELASEILADSDRKDKRKNMIIIGLVIAIIVITLYYIYQWTSYDYVSQDGTGYNYYNSDVEGNVNNVAEDQEEKGPEEE